MSRTTLFLGISIIAVLLPLPPLIQLTINQNGNAVLPRLLYFAVLLCIVLAGIWAMRRKWLKILFQLAAWMMLLLVLMIGYLLRNDATFMLKRLQAGLFPGSVVALDAGKSIIIRKNGTRHFIANISVNGQMLHMLIDTGASLTTLSYKDAQKLKLHPERLKFSMVILTANGRTKVAPIHLKTILIGPILRKNMAATVAQKGSLDQSLLGMNVLETLSSLQIRPGELILTD